MLLCKLAQLVDQKRKDGVKVMGYASKPSQFNPTPITYNESAAPGWRDKNKK